MASLLVLEGGRLVPDLDLLSWFSLPGMTSPRLVPLLPSHLLSKVIRFFLGALLKMSTLPPTYKCMHYITIPSYYFILGLIFLKYRFRLD